MNSTNQADFLIYKKNSIDTKKAFDGSLVGVVTYEKYNGEFYVLSQYEHDEWKYPKHMATKGLRDNLLTLNFNTIHNEHRLLVKWIVFNKMKEGVALNSLIGVLKNLRCFFAWINQSDVMLKNGLTVFLAQQYVAYVNSLKGQKDAKGLAVGTKTSKFIALEQLYQYCKDANFVKEHPWIESSASEQAGNVGTNKRGLEKSSGTPVIPDDVLHPLVKFAEQYINRADELLGYSRQLDSFLPTLKYVSIQKKKHLQSLGWDGSLKEFNDEILTLRDCCIFWILFTTGMRIHEVLGIKHGESHEGYRFEIEDDEPENVEYDLDEFNNKIYYVKSKSEKTHEGETEWVCPESTTNAINILSAYCEPLQLQVEKQLQQAKLSQDISEIKRLEALSGSVFLCKTPCKENQISVLSSTAVVSKQFPKLTQKAGVDWNLSPHQLRRTFANYVAHSDLGDLRYLRDHFKHWTMGMTSLYAANQALDHEVYEEILRERYNIEQEIKEDWFSLEAPITGGEIAKKIIKIRSNDEIIKTFDSRETMIKSYTASVPLRATGLAWCTNDDDGCLGGKCETCEHGIVDLQNADFWKGMLIQQLELSDLLDIGRTGKEAVRKGMERCESVLTALGKDVNQIKIDTQREMNHAD